MVTDDKPIEVSDGMLYADTIGDVWHVRGAWRSMIWDGECWNESDAFKRRVSGPPRGQERVVLVLATGATPATLRRACALIMQASGPRPADDVGTLTLGRNGVNWAAFEAIARKLAVPT
jgi:hypothetical protein